MKDEKLSSSTQEIVSIVGNTRKTLWILILFIASILTWAAYFEIDKASLAEGEVIPTSKVKRIQHLEGGIIENIFVQEGQFINKGSKLVELENTASVADLNELDARISSLKIKKQRLQLQLNGEVDFKVDKSLQSLYPEQVEIASRVLTSNIIRLNNKLAIQEQVIVQKQEEILEIKDQIKNLIAGLKLQRRRIQIDRELQTDGLTNEFEHLNLLKEENSLSGKISEYQHKLPRLKSLLVEAKLNLLSIKQKEDELLLKELEEIRKQLIEFRERRKKLLDHQDRTMVKSPIEGIIKSIYYVTVGGVIPPGGTLMTIVPKDEAIVIRARLMVGDVGFVRLGQDTKISLLSSGGKSFQSINGKVSYISADSIIEGDRPPYYDIKVIPNFEYFSNGKQRYPLKPGVQVSIAILTGKRTVLRYIIDPLVNGMSGALIEP
ncbi:HlyD family type I secretion periplasmic adaptor subunit [bacterium]|nr:HlyD family type I secretion periplasmic adaptor subunit [bacterium]